jgi:outer membrane protein assembly factor BamB
MKLRGLILVCALILCFASAGADNWPQFRGVQASGVAEGATPPVSWDVSSRDNVAWAVDVPGLAHSCPVVWGDRIYLTTAVSDETDPELKVGLYGDIQPVEGDGEHRFVVMAFDLNTGDIIWTETAHTGVPKVKRHPKSTHANPTPATDGEHVVAFFGSEGLYCYDAEGELLWSKDFGVLDSGFFMMKSAQWGFASSPVIHEDKVIVQCDTNDNSFVAALDLETGEEIWRTARDETPTWSTPTIYEVDGETRVAVNGWKHIGGYDIATGGEIWNLRGGGDLPVPTPVVAHGLIFIHNAHGRMSPIYAIRQDAEGDISLDDGALSNEHVAWSIERGGAYMPTGLVYGDHFYNLRINGRLSCFDAKTGERIYEERVGNTGEGFTASPVAANGHLYLASENGIVYVVKAGPEFKVIAQNNMNGICMATPAIVDDTLLIRTQNQLVKIESK